MPAKQTKTVRLYTEDPIESLWEYLSLYESSVLASKLIQEKANLQGINLSTEDLEAKSTALAYCLRNARENITFQSPSLTTRATANYYGCLWLICAVIVGEPHNCIDLRRLESFTKGGHGLQNVEDESANFPDSEFVYVRNSGLLPEILKFEGLEEGAIKKLCPEKKIKDVKSTSAEDRDLLVSLNDLFARIPELKNIYKAVTGRNPLWVVVMEDAQELVLRARIGTELPDTRTVAVRLHGSQEMSKEEVEELESPVTDLEFKDDAWVGKISCNEEQPWSTSCTNYHSTLAGTSYIWIKRLLKSINSGLVIHLMLLYELSILARYRPAVWREILEGKYSEYRGLIQAYNRLFARVVPELVLGRLVGKSVHVISPGGLFGP
jgi:hypothetical protein